MPDLFLLVPDGDARLVFGDLALCGEVVHEARHRLPVHVRLDALTRLQLLHFL